MSLLNRSLMSGQSPNSDFNCAGSSFVPRACRRHILTGLAALLLIEPSGWAEKRPDLVVVGDSLSAGFQNDSLHELQQPHGYAKLIAESAGVDLVLPLIGAPGFPNVLE